ncbi:hypothetical protein ACHAWF_014395 [Thalassiosira exigua]
MDPAPPAPEAYADPPPAYADPSSPVHSSDEEYESSQGLGGDDGDEGEEVSQETEDREEDDDDTADLGDDRTEEEEDAAGDGDNDGDDARRGGGGRGDRPPSRPGTAGSNRPPRDYRHLRLKSTPALPLLTDPDVAPTVREIGRTASWSLSTAKPGNGVDQLRDSSLDTYWQSDGLQPHYINIQFPRRQTVCAIALYMDFNLDESYTPKRMKVRAGTTFHNLEEVRTVDVREPCGWCTVPLWRRRGEDVLDGVLDPEGAGGDNDDAAEGGRGGRRTRVPPWRRKPLRTHLVQICILSMHQNGRDTHVRQVKIFGPRDRGHGTGVGAGGGGAGGCLGTGLGALGPRGGIGAGGGARGPGGSKGGAAEPMTTGKLSVPAFQTVAVSQFSVIR